jgi:hypothetical protein
VQIILFLIGSHKTHKLVLAVKIICCSRNLVVVICCFDKIFVFCSSITMSTRRQVKKPMDEAKFYVMTNVDRDGFEKRFVSEEIGESLFWFYCILLHYASRKIQ